MNSQLPSDDIGSDSSSETSEESSEGGSRGDEFLEERGKRREAGGQYFFSSKSSRQAERQGHDEPSVHSRERQVRGHFRRRRAYQK